MPKTDDKSFSLAEAIRKAYRAGQEDEALEPIVRVDSRGRPLGRPETGDYAIFYDIRGEREIELTQSLTDPDFDKFSAKKGLSLRFVTMIEYASHLSARVAFPPEVEIRNTLTEVLTRSGLRVAKISESEKAVHVSHFFNGKNDRTFPGEERIVVPSPQGIRSYADAPEMSAPGVSSAIEAKLKDGSCDVVIANYANVDVVGHLEDKAAVLKAIETVDREFGSVAREARRQNFFLVITSDHGTVEEWLYPDGSVNTGHTKNPVPFILVDFDGEPEQWELRPEGELADIAPTILEIAGLEKPREMTGESLLIRKPVRRKNKILILILDGWGVREEKYGNLITEAKTPNFHWLWENLPHSTLKSFGEAVGMPARTVGNSEAGHLHIGAGRRIFLDRVKIDRAIADGSFFSNPAFLWAMEGAVRDGKALHLMGIVSHYSSHGTIDHLFALLRLARQLGVPRTCVHAFIGRRGEKPESGAIYVEKVEEMCRSLAAGEVVTVMGRFWSLDREENWDRIEKAYRAIVFGEGTKVYPKAPR